MSPKKPISRIYAAFAICLAMGVFAVPAGAAQRVLLITFVDGTKTTLTVEAPADTPVSQIQLPALSQAVASVQEQFQAVTTQPTTDQWTVSSPTVTSPTSSTETDTTTESEDAEGKSFAKGGTSNSSSSKKSKKKKKLSWRDPNGIPTKDNPTVSIVDPGIAPIGVPNFMIDKFRVPPFLLPIYQAAGTEYGIPWQVLAAINEVETDYGRNLSVSSAGARGWMQFMPASWKAYGVDANNDKQKDPNNPADAIFAAARYLHAAGAEKDLRKAIFAYNHADWYVDMVMVRAKMLGGIPEPIVSSLTGLTEGRFPIDAKATYADDVNEADLKKDSQKADAEKDANPAVTVDADPNRRSIKIFADTDSSVVAVNDGKIKEIGTNEELGNYVILRDVYGNEYTYSHLRDLSEKYLAPKPQKISREDIARELKLPDPDPKPAQPANATDKATYAMRKAKSKEKARQRAKARKASLEKERLFAHPTRPRTYKEGGRDQLLNDGEELAEGDSMKKYFSGVYGLEREEVVLKPLGKGSQVIGGTVLGHVGAGSDGLAPHIQFEIRPAGRGAPKIDPKPILDGWKLLETTAAYRAAGMNPFVAKKSSKDGRKLDKPTIGQILLMSKEKLQQIVLADPRIKIYGCGREDIQAGIIDRRVLATLEYLASSGLKPTVTSLQCGHSLLTASGNVSEHSSGSAVDIAEINDIPILGHQGKDSITERTILALLDLQGLMKPHQIISLMKFKDQDNTFAMGDHNDHIHVGFRPFYSDNPKIARYMRTILKPGQWDKLMQRLNAIDNPKVSNKISKFSIPDSEPLTDREAEK